MTGMPHGGNPPGAYPDRDRGAVIAGRLVGPRHPYLQAAPSAPNVGLTAV
ncbi:hypothetical protein G8767_22250 [Rhodococcus sp. IC4_135]|nr:hypothetical protein [Rhodococcus sp. IC4_135]